jgi:hypothetical protein
MKRKRPAGAPRTLGDMRPLGLCRLKVLCLNPACQHEALLHVNNSLLALSKQPDDVVVRSAVIESFFTHVRDLLDFFCGHYKGLSASAFTNATYQPLPRHAAKSLYARISSQVSHLELGRPSDSAKLNAIDPKIIGLMEAEIARFLDHLKPEWRDRFKCVYPANRHFKPSGGRRDDSQLFDRIKSGPRT